MFSCLLSSGAKFADTCRGGEQEVFVCRVPGWAW